MKVLGHRVQRYRGSRRRLRFIKGRDNAYPVFWAFIISTVAFLFAQLIAFFSP